MKKLTIIMRNKNKIMNKIKIKINIVNSLIITMNNKNHEHKIVKL